MRSRLKHRVRQGRCILSVIGLQLIAEFNVVRMSINAHAQVQVCPLPLGVANCYWKIIAMVVCCSCRYSLRLGGAGGGLVSAINLYQQEGNPSLKWQR